MDLSLYVITDENLQGRNLIYAVEQAIQGGATVIQYRAKNKTSKLMYQEAIALKKLCSRYKIPFIVNDRVDIALAVDADGVHVGQDDLDVKTVRNIIGNNKILGLSTKNTLQIEEANYLPVDYVGFGSIFPTSTKEDIVLTGLENLEKALKISLQPVVAIGGINKDNLHQVLKTGCRNIAVVSAIFRPIEKVKENAQTLKKIIKGEL